MKVTLIGLGIMGSRMAKNLIKNNVETTVFNRTLDAATPLKEMGAQVGQSILDSVQQADVVITMLPHPDAIREVMIEPGGLDAMKKGAIWMWTAALLIQCSPEK